LLRAKRWALERTPAIAILEFIVGIVLLVLVMIDVFQSVVLPRRSGSVLRFSPYLIAILWPIWQRIGLRLQPAWRREDFLGTFAPLAIVLMLVVWAATLIFGFGLTAHALADQFQPPVGDYPTAFYIAGTSLLTIGFGDIVATAPLARFLMLVAGAAGLTLVALVISLAFNLYGSFARREVLVLVLDARAGAPPSGVTLLETYGREQIVDELAALFAQFELWTAEMLDSHLAYPILPYFRSAHDGQSWVSALGAVLDAATLLNAAVVDGQSGEAARGARVGADLYYSIGCHAIIDLTQLRWLFGRFDPAHQGPGIERAEFESACRRLAEAGYAADCSDAAWQEFARRRAVYAERLHVLARYFASPPAQWIGDRSTLARRLAPHFG
jgi:hypothetical protein